MAKVDLYQSEGSPHHHTRKDTRLANLGKFAFINYDSFVANRPGQTVILNLDSDDQSWLNWEATPKKVASNVTRVR